MSDQKQEKFDRPVSDVLTDWIKDMDQWVRDARRLGKNKNEPELFSEFIPRIKALVKIFIEVEQQEEPIDPQFCMLRVQTASSLRHYLMERAEHDQAAAALFISVESDLSGDSEVDIAEQLQQLQAMVEEKGAKDATTEPESDNT